MTLCFKSMAGRVAMVVCASAAATVSARASETVYRCGQLYTNQPVSGQRCEVLTGGHVSVVGAAPVANAAAVPTPQAKPKAFASPEQRGVEPQGARSQEALVVLHSEREHAQGRLRQAQSHLKQQLHASPAVAAGVLQAAREAVERAQLDMQSLDREVARWERKQP